MSDAPSPFRFPDHFLWGTATSAHQVEGNNRYSDWWEWEQSQARHESLKREGKNPEDYISGQACDHYHRFEEDIELMAQGGQNAHRLSIEWARIEPREGEWRQEEVEHYRTVLTSLQQRRIKTFVTLWHFTNPAWFSAKGGWLVHANRKYFLRYVDRIARALGPHVDFWITLNEPGVYTQLSYHWGWWPPQQRSLWASIRVFINLALAHRAAYHLLKRVTPSRPVGIANNVTSIEAYRKHHLWDHVMEWSALIIANHLFYRLSGIRTHDFLGINYYFKTRLLRTRGKLKPTTDNVTRYHRAVNDMGWEIHPHGLFDVLMDLSHLHKPIYITENGIPARHDEQRIAFIKDHLREVYHALRAGAPVQGYCYWSLLDNFEWHEGWKPQFGLIAVDRHTHTRTPKHSYHYYRDIITANALPKDSL